LHDAAGFRAWLLSILHAALVDQVRRESRKKRSGGRRGEFGEMLAVADGRPTPAQDAELDEQRRRALAVLRDLPGEYREVLSLRYLAGADYDTIARQLALSNGSLRGLLHRGLTMLRKKLDEREKP
jgi:RNA polymerase sigma-70 factor (ECF subfamily)